MGHKSEKLEKYIGKLVTIEFMHYVSAYGDERRKTYTGILMRNDIGFKPYKLRTKEFDYIFPKSEVIKIKEQK